MEILPLFIFFLTSSLERNNKWFDIHKQIDCDRFRVPSARIVTAVPGPRHRHLRSVHITGFWDLVGIAELALYILENATVLERMVVDPVIWMDKGDLYEGQLYSISKASNCQELVRPKLAKDGLLQHKKFAEKHLNRDEFRHIITIL